MCDFKNNISYNTLKGNDMGIYLEAEHESGIHNNTIYNNDLSFSDNYGVHMINSSDNTFINNCLATIIVTNPHNMLYYIGLYNLFLYIYYKTVYKYHIYIIVCIILLARPYKIIVSTLFNIFYYYQFRN